MKTFDKIKRYNEILKIALENDAFSLLLRFLAAPREHGFIVTEVDLPEGMPLKFRKMLEQLGPSFIKIGQLLSTRPDLMPKAVVEELQNLYDHTTPTPYEEIEKVLEEELGVKINEIFKTFNREPIASASIAQVHRAILLNGEQIAVKIQHPAIEHNMFIDFEILGTVAKFMEREFADVRVWQPEKHLAEFKKMVIKELDFEIEARNQQTFCDNFKDFKEIIIPKVYWKYCTKRILTMEYIEGIKPINAKELADKGIDGKKIAQILTNSMAKQIFLDRYFHGDPSPGNLLVKNDSTIAYLDFGAVGVLTKKRKEYLTQMIMAFITADVEELARSFISICDKEGEIDEKAFMKDVEKVIDYFEREKPSVGDPEILNLIIEASNKHKMLLPPDFMLLMRAWYQFEGLCKRLDPDYDVAVVIGPYMRETVVAQFAKDKQNELMNNLIMEFLKFLEGFPARANTLMHKIENNDFQIKVSITGMKDYIEHKYKQTIFLSLTILIAAIIIGFALVLVTKDENLVMTFLLLSFLLSMLWIFVCIFLQRKN